MRLNEKSVKNREAWKVAAGLTVEAASQRRAESSADAEISAGSPAAARAKQLISQ
jgi:hypothetical protein